MAPAMHTPKSSCSYCAPVNKKDRRTVETGVLLYSLTDCFFYKNPTVAPVPLSKKDKRTGETGDYKLVTGDYTILSEKNLRVPRLRVFFPDNCIKFVINSFYYYASHYR